MNKFQELKHTLFGKSAQQKEIDAAVTQMVNSIKNQRSNFKKEIREWKSARQAALNPERPRRNFLISLYADILGDAVIFGRTDTRKLRISNKGFIIVNGKGEIEPEKTKLLEKQWFNQFIKIAVETAYFAYSLMYPKELDENGYIKKLSLVYRDHVVPETQEILKEVTDEKGVKFTEEPYKKWMFWINYEDSIGLLDKAAPLWIFKKHSWQNWDEFEEMFGIPIRTAKTASTDKRVLAEIDKWLRDLGSAAYGRFPQDVELDIKESSSRDSFNVFNEKRKACNEELAILFDGNFETSKDTGSRAKAEAVIGSTQTLIELDDEMRVQYIVNDDLLPWLRNLGYPFAEDDEFQWNYNEQQQPKDRLAIFKGVKDLGYKIKKEQIETELDVEIVGEYSNGSTTDKETDTDDDPDPDDEKDPKDKTKPKAGFNQPHAHHVGCGCGACDTTYRLIDFSLMNALSQDEEDFIKKYFDNPDSINWNYKDFKVTHNKLLDALKSGFGAIDFDFQSVDHLTMELFQANIHRFGVDKTQKEILDLNEILKTSKDFSEFRTRAKKLFPNYKEKWLLAEWNQAHAVAQMGARYIEMMQDIEIAPYWRFVAVLDERTTEICSKLHGKVFRKDDPKCWIFLPPNHWGCRSDAEDVLASYDGEISTFEDAIAADPDGYLRMSKAGFNVNWGDAGQVFSATQSYLEKAQADPLDISQFDFSAFGLKPFGNITSKANLPDNVVNYESLVDRSGIARIEDIQGMPNWVSREIYESLDEDLKKGLVELFQSPDEIYWMDPDSGNVKKFIKYYKGHTFQGLVSFDKDNRAIVTEVSKITNPDAARNGLLIFTPKEFVAQRLEKFDEYGKDYTKHNFRNDNGGFVVSHNQHNKSELDNNLLTANILKNIGKSVELLPVGEGKTADALVNGVEWEFKLLTNYKNLFNRIKEEVKRGSKQSGNILLHLNGVYGLADVSRGLQAAVINDSSNRVKFISVLFNDGKLYTFSRKQIMSKEFKKFLK